ncbi:helix-turn-helix transcriptional regulator [Chryseosolibacter indicus]|uniref:WYL domain-containing protein n=1 Tax=Chryseosolibacter indicus TaxID=2782351 RepID=A0ABS5VLI8_9BACT|nr:WYL domain-containing protein [Chryseosolibacter indicus]MBT1702318.1 WYL domain-containing protein [Chryseosolibacter indicus]
MKRTGSKRQKEEAIIPQGRLMRLFQIIAVLKQGRWTIQHLAERFDTSERTVYRYIRLLQEVDFLIEKDFYNRYFIITSEDQPTNTQFSIEETKLIKKLIQSGTDDNPLKNTLLKKLALNSELDSMPRLFVKVRTAKLVDEIATAIRNKHQVVLKNYHSANSNEIRDRLVEPIHFGDNYHSVMALDTGDKICKQFKLERIGEVVQVEKAYQFEALHQKTSSDIFGFTGDGNIWVSLELNMRAYLLLREEYPLAIPYLEKKEDKYVFNGPVANYEGIGRFVLGLIDELKIIGPDNFKEFISNKINVFKP